MWFGTTKLPQPPPLSFRGKVRLGSSQMRLRMGPPPLRPLFERHGMRVDDIASLLTWWLELQLLPRARHGSVGNGHPRLWREPACAAYSMGLSQSQETRGCGEAW